MDKMIADIGTKALDPKQFWLLRDKLCGYAEWDECVLPFVGPA